MSAILRSSFRPTPSARQHPSRASDVRVRLASPAALRARLVTWIAGLAAALAVGAIGCASAVPPAVSVGSRLAVDRAPRGSGVVFATVEAAAFDALAAARRDARPADRSRLRVGTIRRVADGYTYGPPARSRQSVDSMSSMKVSYRLSAEDVATYLIHPRSGQPEIDRRNESLGDREKRLVDELDPRHRPLYVLTPSSRVLRYVHGRAEISIVRRDGSEARLPSQIQVY